MQKPSLKHLEMSGCTDSAGDVKFFSRLQRPMSNLTSLGLARNCIDESTAALLMRQIATLSALQFLDLSGNQLHVAGATALASCLSRLTMITFLNISENEICAAGASALGQALPSLVHLRGLNVAANDLRTEGLGHLMPPIVQLAYLAHLDLGRNCIADGGGPVLAMHLSSLASLTRLGLGGSWGGVWHCWDTTVGKHIKSLTALRSLSLRCNGFQATHMGSLAPQLAQVTTLECLDISQNDIRVLAPCIDFKDIVDSFPIVPE
jgi:Ran GTPase-activating protein (RanGAP) involved in mRNA processing and transport